MIRKIYRSDYQALKLAFIEARLESNGAYNNKDMSRIFGNHEKDAARIVRRYREDINPGSLMKQSKQVICENTYRRTVLKRNTDPWEFITMLEMIHGVTDE